MQMISTDVSLGEKIHPSYDYTKAEILYAVKYEMAVTIEDILARRTRLLFLDAAAAVEVAPLVAESMAKALSKDAQWITEQVTQFKRLAKQYLLS